MAILKNASFFSIFNSLHSGKRARYIGAAPTEMLRGTILLHISIRLGVHGAHTDSYWTKLDAAYTRFCLTARVSKTTEEENKEKSEQSIRPKQAENEKEDDSRPQSGRVVMFSVNALYQRPRSDRSMFASTASEGVDGEQERSQRSPIWMAESCYRQRWTESCCRQTKYRVPSRVLNRKPNWSVRSWYVIFLGHFLEFHMLKKNLLCSGIFDAPRIWSRSTWFTIVLAWSKLSPLLHVSLYNPPSVTKLIFSGPELYMK
jgi:hypothetical protein